jgi:hypothetical protein
MYNKKTKKLIAAIVAGILVLTMIIPLFAAAL